MTMRTQAHKLFCSQFFYGFKPNVPTISIPLYQTYKQILEFAKQSYWGLTTFENKHTDAFLCRKNKCPEEKTSGVSSSLSK